MNMKTLKPGWRMVKFGDVVRNANLTVRNLEEAELDRVVGLEHIEPENLHIHRWDDIADGTSFTRRFVPGQTLFGKRRAYQRKVAYAEFEGICSGDILTFESKDRKVLLPELLPFIVQSEGFFEYALGTSAGSLSPRTSWTALQNYEFPLPPIEEQLRIAEILWAADEVVCRNRDNIIALEGLRNAISNHFTSIGLERSLVKLERIAADRRSSFTNGPFGSNLLTSELTDKGVPVVYIRDIKCGIYEMQEQVFITHTKAEELSSCDVLPGDVLISKVGDPPGQACVYPTGYPSAIVTQDVIRIRVNREKAEPYYIKTMFNSPYGRKLIRGITISGTRKRFSLGDLKRINVSLPSLKEQEEACASIKEIERKIVISKEQADQAFQLYKDFVNTFAMMHHEQQHV